MNIYLNDPGGKQWAWDNLRQEVIDKIATLDADAIQRVSFGTLIFMAPPRPESQRRGALWLLEKRDSDVQGALVLRRGDNIVS